MNNTTLVKAYAVSAGKIHIGLAASHRVVYLLFILSTLLLACNNTRQPTPMQQLNAIQQPTPTPKLNTTQERPMFGVKLGPELSAWLNEVEEKFGRPVQTNIKKIKQVRGNLAQSGFNDDGSYGIDLDESVDLKDTKFVEALIAHELLHLRQRTRGFPFYQFDITGSSVPVDSNATDILMDVQEVIEHWIFRGEMKRIGLNEMPAVKRMLKEQLDILKQQELSGRKDGSRLTVFYFKTMLENEDPCGYKRCSAVISDVWLGHYQRARREDHSDCEISQYTYTG